MTTITCLHRTEDRPVRVVCGPAYRPPSRRRPKRGVKRLDYRPDTLTLLHKALTPGARRWAGEDPDRLRLLVVALGATAFGYAGYLELVDGSLACAWPEERKVRWAPAVFGETP